MADVAKLFSDADRARINNAVATAEAKAAVEIVPVVARHSGRYDRAEDVVGLWVGLLALAAAWLFLPREDPVPGSWGGVPEWIQLTALLLAVLLGFIIGAVVASRIDWLRALFSPTREKREEVLGSARQVFFDNRVHHTSGGNGLLIYVSMLEHIAVILADRAIVDKVGQPALDEMCAQLTLRLRTATPTDAFCETIDLAGQRVGAVLPRVEEQGNQLPNALVVIE